MRQSNNSLLGATSNVLYVISEPREREFEPRDPVGDALCQTHHEYPTAPTRVSLGGGGTSQPAMACHRSKAQSAFA